MQFNFNKTNFSDGEDNFSRNKKSKRLLLIGIIVFFVLVVAMCIVYVFMPNVIVKKDFYIGNLFYCHIVDNSIVHNEITGSDDLEINMTIESIYNPSQDMDLENTTGYDSNTPTSDQLSQEQIDQLTNDEINKINEKTINEHLKKSAQKISFSACTNVVCQQGNHILKNSDENNIDLKMMDIQSSNDLDKNILPGEKISVTLKYNLINDDIVMLKFEPLNSELYFEQVNINIDVKKIYDSKLSTNQLTNESRNYASSTGTVDFIAATINLVDNWVVDNQGQVNCKLKNQKFPKASVSFSYCPSNSKEELIQQRANLVNPIPIIQEKYINEKLYLYYVNSDGNFVFCTTGKNSLPFLIIANGVDNQDILPLIENLSF